MAVREHDPDDVVEAVPDRFEVGQDQVDTGLVVFGEEHTAVDDEKASKIFEDRHVPPDFTETSQCDDAQCAVFEGWWKFKVGLGMTHVASRAGWVV
jgi:hypothetical protein